MNGQEKSYSAMRHWAAGERSDASRSRGSQGRRPRVHCAQPETFQFIGFTHICAKSRQGRFLLNRKSRRDRMRAKLKAIKQELKRRMHQPIPV
jgi:hypothetical protein